MPQIDSPADRLSVFARSFLKAVVILLLPLLQIAFLRFFLHSVLGLRLGFANMTDYDLFLPAATGYFILMYVLEEGESLALRIQKPRLILNLILFLSFLLLNHYFDSLAASFWVGPFLFVTLWFSCLLGMFFSAFLSFFSPRYLLRNPNRFALLPCLLIAFSVVIYSSYIQAPWSPFSNLINETLKMIFHHNFYAGAISSITPEGYLKITHPRLVLRIGKGCGGMESLFFFTQLFFLYFVLRRSRFTGLKWILSYLSGMTLMFSLNVFRIVLLFWIGIWLRTKLGIPHGTEILKNLFHTHIGWVLYSGGCLGFFSGLSYFSRVSLKKARPLNTLPTISPPSPISSPSISSPPIPSSWLPVPLRRDLHNSSIIPG